MIEGVVFDHLAVAAADKTDLVGRYAGDLGARFVVEGGTAGLQATIVRFGNGVKLEAIEPDESAGEDFLARFLSRHGAGVHHVTFVVGDVRAAADETEAAGLRLMGSRTDFLQEVFVHPKDASGIVVQYIEPRQYRGEPPDDYPRPERDSDLEHVTLVVASLDAATGLFVDLLGGRVAARAATGDEHRSVDVSWPGPGTIRLVEPDPSSELRGWLGDRPGAVHHLALCVDHPGEVPGARMVAPERWEVDPSDNFGVGLCLRPRTSADDR
jgi:methylmalonyl-CoA/ethylmalonyl-CoA epimerase